jgi:hypothetical protein
VAVEAGNASYTSSREWHRLLGGHHSHRSDLQSRNRQWNREGKWERVGRVGSPILFARLEQRPCVAGSELGFSTVFALRAQ